ncbi:hypothetical protein MASR2M15_27380 [Anaerolineales bacterium]
MPIPIEMSMDSQHKNKILSKRPTLDREGVAYNQLQIGIRTLTVARQCRTFTGLPLDIDHPR